MNDIDTSDPADVFRKLVRCGSCRGSLAEGHINVVTLNKRATWEFPSCGNVLTGESQRAVSFLCDRCLGTKQQADEAVEIVDGDAARGEVRYHAIDTLADLPPEPTYHITPDGDAIRCLICGLLSHNQNDVVNKYCGHCHQFHPIT